MKIRLILLNKYLKACNTIDLPAGISHHYARRSLKSHWHDLPDNQLVFHFGTCFPNEVHKYLLGLNNVLAPAGYQARILEVKQTVMYKQFGFNTHVRCQMFNV